MKISLKALRVNADLNQEAAASKLNITVKTLQNWESYVTFPTALQLMNICKIYGCEMTDIFLPDKLAKS